jgi:ribonuclease HI
MQSQCVGGEKSQAVTVYTDGSCLGNPGPGGWSFLVLSDGGVEKRSGGEVKTTNNRMELQAVIEALLFVPNNHIEVHTDSLLVLNCATNVWKRKANLDLWTQFDQASTGKQLMWKWVRGHAGDKYNEEADRLARQKAIKYQTL